MAAVLERLAAAGCETKVEVGLVLGSGLSFLADEAEDTHAVPYRDIEGFPRATVPGHAGNFVVGTIDGTRVAFAQGRFHYYEGWDAAQVALPVRVLHALGARFLLVTNAAGSLDRRMAPGSLMAIRDHINLQFANPLIGRPQETIDVRFPDLSRTWSPELRARLHAVATAIGERLHEGVYAGVSGPSYETPAEIRFLRRIGADAVGMSTVAEAIVAAELGFPVAGVSLLTNYAAGLARGRLTHDDVTRAAERTHDRLVRLLRAFLGGLTGAPHSGS